jgi:predicted enzyme related to lactoylglutathione lyase
MDARLSYMILGVSDLANARKFYETAFGAKPSRAGSQLATFEFQGATIGLMPRAMLAALTGSGGSGSTNVALVQMARARQDVDAALASATAAGGTIVQAAGEGPWGGYAGSFADPDGNIWAVACNPDFFKS